MQKDFYGILGVSTEASQEEIKVAFKKLSKKFHPDVNNGDKLFELKFREIREAYETLIDASKRKEYDLQRKNWKNQYYISPQLKKEQDDLKRREEIINKREADLRKKENSKRSKYSAFIVFVVLVTSLNVYLLWNNKNQEESTIPELNNASASIITTTALDHDEPQIDSIIVDGENSIALSAANQFLITNNSVGYFELGGSWRNLASDHYDYSHIQKYGICWDGSCDGGFTLGKNMKLNEYGWVVDNGYLTIGAALFDRSEDQQLHLNNNDVFFSESDHTNHWYWKDKINYIVVLSDSFKTAEGIGVGTLLSDVYRWTNGHKFCIGYVEEDENAIELTYASLPNVRLICNANDFLGDLEEISLSKGNNTVTFSDFRYNSKIIRIIVYPYRGC